LRWSALQRLTRGTARRRELALDDATLDRIDEIVPPGTNLYRPNWQPPVLADPASRRRPVEDRAAA